MEDGGQRSEVRGRRQRSEVGFPNFPISAFSFCLVRPTVAGRFHVQAVLRRGVLDCLPAGLVAVESSKEEVITKGGRSQSEGTSAEMDRASGGIRAAGWRGARPVASVSGARFSRGDSGSLANRLRDEHKKRKYAIMRDPSAFRCQSAQPKSVNSERTLLPFTAAALDTFPCALPTTTVYDPASAALTSARLNALPFTPLIRAAADKIATVTPRIPISSD